MNRLTYKEPNGNWGIVGMNKENEDQKMYGVACKLLDYEETGLDPNEVENIVEKIAEGDLVEPEVAAQMSKNAELIHERIEEMGGNVLDRLAEFKELRDKIANGILIPAIRCNECKHYNDDPELLYTICEYHERETRNRSYCSDAEPRL